MRIATFLIALSLATGAAAQTSDPRVQIIAYDPGRVVDLVVDSGFAAVVELGREEAVESIIVGNSAVWQVTVDGSGNRVVVKPLAGAVATDMILLTAERRYVFMLHPSNGSGQGHLVLAFSYPQPAAPAGSPASTNRAGAFRFGGVEALYPKAMRAHGQRTVITWDEQAALPAVFAIGENGEETIVNGRMVGRDFVIEGAARRYVFRLGDQRAVATRRDEGRGR